METSAEKLEVEVKDKVDRIPNRMINRSVCFIASSLRAPLDYNL